MVTSRRALLILGMHRSGTSALTRLLNIYGAALPADLLPANDGNVSGYWEPSTVVAFHDRVLDAAGSQWDDPLDIDPAWFGRDAARAFVPELAALVTAEFGDAPLIVVKDPRACRLVPLWREALATLGIEPLAVILIRDPLEVEASLHRRDGRPRGAGMALWLQHVLAAESDSRGMRRVFLTYEQLLTDRPATIARIEQQLGIALPSKTAEAEAEAATFLDPSLRHERRAGEVSSWPEDVREACAWFERASHTSEPIDPGPLEAIRARLRAAELRLGASLRWRVQQESRWLGLAKDAAVARHDAEVERDIARARLREREQDTWHQAEEWRRERVGLQEAAREAAASLSHAREEEAALRKRVRAVETSMVWRFRAWLRGTPPRS